VKGFFYNYFIYIYSVQEIETSQKHGSYGTMINYTTLLYITITGSTYTQTSALFNLLGIGIGSESFYNKKVSTELNRAVSIVTKKFIEECRLLIEDKNDVHVVVDAGWSHPGWWARECTVIGLDGNTGLPIGIINVSKGKHGIFQGSSKAMEGFGIKKMMEQFQFLDIKVTRVIHDKDSSTMKQVMDVYQDVEEALCLSKYFCLFIYIFRSWL
jgi:hypothetical protein